MSQCIATDANSATSDQEIERQVDEALEWLRPQLIDLTRTLRTGRLTPTQFHQFELALMQLLLAFGRRFLELVVNGIEGDGRLLPRDMIYDGLGYRRLGKKTRNAHVATLFGTICLWRFGYRCWDSIREACIFPLEQQLGLVEGITPALADHIGRRMAEAGATQNRVLEQLKDEHHVSLGVKRLRRFTAALSEGLSEHSGSAQVEALLQALQRANARGGNRKPVLAVGRDGITMCEYKHRFWEVATVATFTVFDRSGKRLTTVYLAHPPELGQATMGKKMTDLLTEVLQRWEGPLPTLAYVADSGGNESSYFEDILWRMRHPRTGAALEWVRVVDYFHAAERVWAMSAALFGKGTPQYHAWARRMLRTLKSKPNGVKRVLHSAATLRIQNKLGKTRTKEFRKAYRYLQKRTKWMRYHAYKRQHIPLGSGITEAACKTVFTQRMKLSGMRWTKTGAGHILTLRTILLSDTWQATYRKTLDAYTKALPRPYATQPAKTLTNAA